MNKNLLRSLLVFLLFAGAVSCSENGAKQAENTDKPATETTAPAYDGFVLNIISSTPQNKDITAALKAEAAKAKAKGMKPFVFFHASWCGPCKQLIKNLKNPLMTGAFKGNYIVEVDTDEWGEEIQRVKCPVNSIPAFCRVEDDGSINSQSLTDASQWDVTNPETAAPVLKAYFAGH